MILLSQLSLRLATTLVKIYGILGKIGRIFLNARLNLLGTGFGDAVVMINGRL